MTDFGCACCKRRHDCLLDPSMCLEYERDSLEVTKVLVGQAVRETNEQFVRVATWPTENKIEIQISTRTEMDGDEKRCALRAIAAKLTALNEEHELFTHGTKMEVTFECLAWENAGEAQK